MQTAALLRPTYESAADRANETATIDKFMARYGAHYYHDAKRFTARKLSMKSRVDWAIEHAGKVVAWVECKRRNCASDKYPTFMLSLDKWMAGLHLQEYGKAPFLVVVEFDDGLYYVHASQARYSVGMGGRTDRNDPQDVEPVAFIEAACLRKL